MNHSHHHAGSNADRRATSLSLDLDNKWSYLKIHGDPWEHLPSYLDIIVPHILSTTASHGLTITVFVVGQDAEMKQHQDLLASVAEAGHEIGNHSFAHDPWLHRFSEQEIRAELVRADTAITNATGHRPSGFRGPGYSMSTATIHALADLGYRYDATTFPNVLNPLGRAYYLRTSDFSPEERAQRAALFGTWRDALRPNKPFSWDLGDGETLTEIPVTTLPVLKIPIHFSYLLYVAGFSQRAARQYLRTALRICAMTGTAPSLLLHPLDFLGGDEDPDLAFFPGMRQRGRDKRRVLHQLIEILTDRYEILTMADHAARAEPSRMISPSFTLD